MSQESTVSSPYEAVLADLRAKRAEIDNTIKVLESLSGLKLVEAPSGGVQWAPANDAPEIVETSGMFLGMSIVDAAKKLLAMRKQTLGNVQIAREIQAGGLVLSGKDPVNVVGSVLTRRFNDVGDVVKVGRGIWGLKEWYPGRTFKSGAKATQAQQSAEADSEHSLTQPSYGVSDSNQSTEDPLYG